MIIIINIVTIIALVVDRVFLSKSIVFMKCLNDVSIVGIGGCYIRILRCDITSKAKQYHSKPMKVKGG
jgi:hypothetical protein